MDTIRLAHTSAVSNLTVGIDCSTAVTSNCQKTLYEGSKVQCDFCAKSFTTEGNLKNHIVIVHESKIPFQNSILDTSD